MSTNGIAQFKEPFLLLHRGPAQKYMGLDPHILDFLDADDFVNIDSQQLMLFVLHPQP